MKKTTKFLFGLCLTGFLIQNPVSAQDIKPRPSTLHKILLESEKFPKKENMTQIIGKPNVDFEINFLELLTLSQIKENGIKLQAEIEELFKKHGVQSAKITYTRTVT